MSGRAGGRWKETFATHHRVQSSKEKLAMAPKNLDPKPVTRRSFLKTTGAIAGAAGLAPALSAPFVSTALAQTKALSIVQWSHFVPQFDTWFDGFAKDWGKKNGI